MIILIHIDNFLKSLIWYFFLKLLNNLCYCKHMILKENWAKWSCKTPCSQCYSCSTKTSYWIPIECRISNNMSKRNMKFINQIFPNERWHNGKKFACNKECNTLQKQFFVILIFKIKKNWREILNDSFLFTEFALIIFIIFFYYSLFIFFW